MDKQVLKHSKISLLARPVRHAYLLPCFYTAGYFFERWAGSPIGLYGSFACCERLLRGHFCYIWGEYDGYKSMSHQSELSQAQHLEHDNGDVDVTKHQFPQQVLEAFIANAPRGAQAVYCRGPFLVSYSLGEFARKMHLQGRCDLVQRRIKVGRSAIFEYLMVKR